MSKPSVYVWHHVVYGAMNVVSCCALAMSKEEAIDAIINTGLSLRSKALREKLMSREPEVISIDNLNAAILSEDYA